MHYSDGRMRNASIEQDRQLKNKSSVIPPTVFGISGSGNGFLAPRYPLAAARSLAVVDAAAPKMQATVVQATPSSAIWSDHDWWPRRARPCLVSAQSPIRYLGAQPNASRSVIDEGARWSRDPSGTEPLFDRT